MRFRNPQSGFLDFRLDFWISDWISGFQLDFWISEWISDFRVDFWISDWISGFQLDFWISEWISDFRVDFWISDWISANSVQDFFRDGPLRLRVWLYETRLSLLSRSASVSLLHLLDQGRLAPKGWVTRNYA